MESSQLLLTELRMILIFLKIYTLFGKHIYTTKIKTTTFSFIFTRKITFPYLRYLYFCQFYSNNLSKKCDCLHKWVKIFFRCFIYVFAFTTAMLPFNLIAVFIQFLTTIGGSNSMGESMTKEMWKEMWLDWFYFFVFSPFFCFSIVTWPFVINVQKSFLTLHPRRFCLWSHFALSPEKLNNFLIKPQKIMWRFTILMQK